MYFTLYLRKIYRYDKRRKTSFENYFIYFGGNCDVFCRQHFLTFGPGSFRAYFFNFKKQFYESI